LDVAGLRPGQPARCGLCGQVFVVPRSIGATVSRHTNWLITAGVVALVGLVAVALLGLIAALAIPSLVRYTDKVEAASLANWGERVRMVQGLRKVEMDAAAPYASNLDELLEIDPGLTDDPEITFVFGPTNAEGYTFTVEHATGDSAPQVFTSEDAISPVAPDPLPPEFPPAA